MQKLLMTSALLAAALILNQGAIAAGESSQPTTEPVAGTEKKDEKAAKDLEQAGKKLEEAGKALEAGKAAPTEPAKPAAK